MTCYLLIYCHSSTVYNLGNIIRFMIILLQLLVYIILKNDLFQFVSYNKLLVMLLVEIYFNLSFEVCYGKQYKKMNLSAMVPVQRLPLFLHNAVLGMPHVSKLMFLVLQALDTMKKAGSSFPKDEAKRLEKEVCLLANCG